MSWRDRMGPATFRGVPFFLDSAERSGGRRGVTHEYPLRDEPFREDLGRKSREFPVEAYVLGADYIAARDALLDALEKSGPGELVHPYHGTRRVAVVDFRCRESADRGGMAQFSISFVETPTQAAQPTAIPDSAAKVRTSAAAAKVAVGAEFSAKYYPGSLLNSAADAVRSATLALDGVVSTVAGEAQEIAAQTRRIAALRDSANSLVGLPDDLLSGIAGIFDAFTDPAGLLGLYDFDPGVRPPATTANRINEQTNFDALHRLVQRLVVVQAAQLAVDQVFSDYDAAIASRDAILALLDEQTEVAADDTYPALLQLRAHLLQAIPGDAGALARLVSYTPPATIPSLVLAHQLYGDLDLEADLLTRNHVADPGFVPGNVPLEVLGRG